MRWNCLRCVTTSPPTTPPRREYESRPVDEWTTTDVSEWAKDTGLRKKTRKLLRESKIKGPTLLELQTNGLLMDGSAKRELLMAVHSLKIRTGSVKRDFGVTPPRTLPPKGIFTEVRTGEINQPPVLKAVSPMPPVAATPPILHQNVSFSEVYTDHVVRESHQVATREVRALTRPQQTVRPGTPPTTVSMKLRKSPLPPVVVDIEEHHQRIRSPERAVSLARERVSIPAVRSPAMPISPKRSTITSTLPVLSEYRGTSINKLHNRPIEICANTTGHSSALSEIISPSDKVINSVTHSGQMINQQKSNQLISVYGNQRNLNIDSRHDTQDSLLNVSTPSLRMSDSSKCLSKKEGERRGSWKHENRVLMSPSDLSSELISRPSWGIVTNKLPTSTMQSQNLSKTEIIEIDCDESSATMNISKATPRLNHSVEENPAAVNDVLLRLKRAESNLPSFMQKVAQIDSSSPPKLLQHAPSPRKQDVKGNLPPKQLFETSMSSLVGGSPEGKDSDSKSAFSPVRSQRMSHSPEKISPNRIDTSVDTLNAYYKNTENSKRSPERQTNDDDIVMGTSSPRLSPERRVPPVMVTSPRSPVQESFIFQSLASEGIPSHYANFMKNELSPELVSPTPGLYSPSSVAVPAAKWTARSPNFDDVNIIDHYNTVSQPVMSEDIISPNHQRAVSPLREDWHKRELSPTLVRIGEDIIPVTQYEGMPPHGGYDISPAVPHLTPAVVDPLVSNILTPAVVDPLILTPAVVDPLILTPAELIPRQCIPAQPSPESHQTAGQEVRQKFPEYSPQTGRRIEHNELPSPQYGYNEMHQIPLDMEVGKKFNKSRKFPEYSPETGRKIKRNVELVSPAYDKSELVYSPKTSMMRGSELASPDQYHGRMGVGMPPPVPMYSPQTVRMMQQGSELISPERNEQLSMPMYSPQTGRLVQQDNDLIFPKQSNNEIEMGHPPVSMYSPQTNSPRRFVSRHSPERPPQPLEQPSASQYLLQEPTVSPIPCDAHLVSTINAVENRFTPTRDSLSKYEHHSPADVNDFTESPFKDTQAHVVMRSNRLPGDTIFVEEASRVELVACDVAPSRSAIDKRSLPGIKPLSPLSVNSMAMNHLVKEKVSSARRAASHHHPVTITTLPSSSDRQIVDEFESQQSLRLPQSNITRLQSRTTPEACLEEAFQRQRERTQKEDNSILVVNMP